MKKILVLGAGKSATSLLDYLCDLCDGRQTQLRIADLDTKEIAARYSGRSGVALTDFRMGDGPELVSMISNCDLVISMLPARFHPEVARVCLQEHKHLLTPSYVSAEMRGMASEVESSELLFLNELGLDPGIDHMSAMQLLDGLKEEGAEIRGFESFTGGLVAPESDDNPWHYKFTWNPRNVVLAGQGEGGVKFLHNGRHKYIPYHKLFQRTEMIDIEGYGRFEGYANRDSLKYQNAYGLESVRTMYRGTLRRPGFCRAWDALVQIGATDDSYLMEDVASMSKRQFINSFLKYRTEDSVELKLAYYLQTDVDSESMKLLAWLGLFKDEPIGLEQNASPAQILQHILVGKWSMRAEDIDMIVMWHKINYRKQGEDRVLESSLVVKGDPSGHSAMSKTVGLPIGIAAKLLLEGKLKLRGVHIPTHANVYESIMTELNEIGISLKKWIGWTKSRLFM